MLTQLTYASRAIQNLNNADLRSIVSSAWRNNTQYGLTGVLCHFNGTFLQYLEGERLSVNSFYQHLLKDERHSQLQILSAYDIFERRFPVFLMGFLSYESDANQLFLNHSKKAKLSPFHMTSLDANNFFNEVVKHISINK